jgi:hypothetical protein
MHANQSRTHERSRNFENRRNLLHTFKVRRLNLACKRHIPVFIPLFVQFRM